MTKEAIEIEKNVGIPPISPTVRESKYPFSKMEVNDSFFVAGAKASAMHACVSRFVKHKGTGQRFAIRTVVEDGGAGVRVWRVE